MLTKVHRTMHLPSPVGRREQARLLMQGQMFRMPGDPTINVSEAGGEGFSSSDFQTAGYDPFTGCEINSVGHDKQLFLIKWKNRKGERK